MTHHVLVVDDDDDILALLSQYLRKHGCDVSVASSGAAMFTALKAATVDVIVLDVLLHSESGFSLCEQLRRYSNVPIIILTALSEATDRVVGLEIGADDYLTKPFDARELLARIKAVLRRSERAVATRPNDSNRLIFSFGKWRLDVARRELRADDNTLVFLSGSEFELLLTFAEHPQRVLSRDMIMDIAKGTAYSSFDRSIDVQISRLRRKLEDDPKMPHLIRTVRNGGYIFMAPVSRL